jgi:catechol 2,3-dioxygenase-like lactoylglutathione lyase family enzyme
MDLKLRLLVLPVSDLDRAKAFYEKAGFRLDLDSGGDHVGGLPRRVQLRSVAVLREATCQARWTALSAG